MRRKLFKILKMFLLTFFVVFSASVALFMERLHQGPIDIDHLVPYLEKLTPDEGNKFSVGTARMEWGKISHPVQFVFSDFKIYSKEDRLIGSIPKLSFSFYLPSLLRGTLTPRTLVIQKPYLHIHIDKAGQIGEETNEKSLSVDTVLQMLKKEDHLKKFSLEDAEIQITDEKENIVWHLPKVNLKYTRRFGKNSLRGRLVLIMRNNKPLNVSLNGKWRRQKLTLNLSTENLDFANLTATEIYPYLKNFTIPVNVSLQTTLDVAPLIKTQSIAVWPEMISDVKMIVSGKSGAITLPAPINARYDIDGFTLNSVWRDKGNIFEVPSFNVSLKSGGSAWAKVYAAGVSKAIDEQDFSRLKVSITGGVKDIRLDKLIDYWPSAAAPDVHEWITANVKSGIAPQGKITMTLEGTKDEILLKDLTANADLRDVSLTYLDGMPAVEGGSGKISFTPTDIVIDVSQAHTQQAFATQGSVVHFSGLTDPITYFHLTVDGYGEIKSIMNILNAPPLDLLAPLGFTADNVSGTAKGVFKMDFPLGDVFSPDKIKYFANGEAHQVDLRDYSHGLGIQGTALTLTLRDDLLSIDGKGLFYSGNTSFSLRQSFDPAAEIQTSIKASVDLNDKARKKIDIALLKPPVVFGVVPTTFEITRRKDGNDTLSINADLTNTEIFVREIGWKKDFQTKGTASALIEFNDTGLTAVNRISLTDATGTDIQGRISFNADNGIEKISFAPIKTMRTNAVIDVLFQPENKLDITLNGTELDISGLIEGKTSFTTEDKSFQAGKKGQEYGLNINAKIGTLWLSAAGYSENNSLTAVYRDSMWRKMDVAGSVGKQKVPATMTLTPTTTEDVYTVRMTSADAGYVLKALDYISSVKGGKLDMNGTYSTQNGTSGIVTINDFYMEEQQVLVRLLMMTSLTGIIDLIRGEGLHFKEANIPFQINDDALTIKDALIAGNSLGITLKGKYYRNTGYLNIRGSLIPFYTINSFFGKIPLVGRLFSGEKGGGLLAPTYTIKGKLPSPDISVNGFSALAPGAIRSLFGIGADDSDLSLPESQQTTPPAEQPQPTVQFPDKETELNDSLIRETVRTVATTPQKSRPSKTRTDATAPIPTLPVAQ